MKTLQWQSLTDGKAAFHLARNGAGKWREVVDHNHNFVELFAVMQDRAVHRVNGRRVPLTSGDLVLMRPADRHTFAVEPGSEFLIINMAFHLDTLTFLRERYFHDDPAFWGGTATQPATVHLGERQLEWLKGEFRLLERTPPTRLALERFLINLLAEVQPGHLPASTSPHPLPDWLARACAAIRTPGGLVSGPREFARLAGRSVEHVSRVMRARTGLTPTEYVNAARLDHAAAMLLNGGMEILDVADECGFQSISHFYSCFRNQFGVSPRRYRLRHRRVFG